MSNEDQTIDAVEDQTGDEEVKINKEEEYLNGWKRAQADYQNLQKEWLAKQATFMTTAREALLFEIIPVLDNLNQALQHLPAEITESEWTNGLKHIQTQWLNMLSGWGIKPIVTVGEQFDPKRHEAFGADDTAPDGQIVRELQGGYETNERVLIPAKVVVGTKK